MPATLSPRSMHAQGWTLLQAMVVVLILAVLCVIALPDLRAVLDRQRASSTRHLLSSHLAFARLAAIQRQAEVSICASLDGKHCAGVNDWQHGWIVYLNRPGEVGMQGPEDILHLHQQHLPAGWRIESSTGRARLRYLNTGRALGTNLSLRICRDEHLFGRVVVNNSGRVRSERRDQQGGCTR